MPFYTLNWQHTHTHTSQRNILIASGALLPLLARTLFKELRQEYKNHPSKYCYRMPNNVQLIQMPHRLGHEIAPLPETIKPYIKATLPWGIIDRLEETLSGAGTKKPVARMDLTFLSLMRFNYLTGCQQVSPEYRCACY